MSHCEQTVDPETELNGKVQTEPLTVEEDNLSPGGLQHLVFFPVEILLGLSVFVCISYTLPLLLKKTHLKLMYRKHTHFHVKTELSPNR